MKRLIETNESAFEELVGQTITLFCVNYIYTGKLTGINDTCVELENPKIVYETGPFDEAEWGNAQALPEKVFVMLALVESFGVMK